MTKPWTNKEIERLIKLKAEGYEAHEIINQFPHRTRNAILGQVYRMRHPKAQKERRAKKPLKSWHARYQTVKRAPDAHPLVQELIRLMNIEQCGVGELCDVIEINQSTWLRWRRNGNLGLKKLTEAFEYLGYELHAVKKEE